MPSGPARCPEPAAASISTIVLRISAACDESSRISSSVSAYIALFYRTFCQRFQLFIRKLGIRGFRDGTPHTKARGASAHQIRNVVFRYAAVYGYGYIGK